MDCSSVGDQVVRLNHRAVGKREIHDDGTIEVEIARRESGDRQTGRFDVSRGVDMGAGMVCHSDNEDIRIIARVEAVLARELKWRNGRRQGIVQPQGIRET